MLSNKQKINFWLYREVFPRGILLFDDILIDGVQKVLGKSRIDAETYVEGFVSLHWNWLVAQGEMDVQHGLLPLFHIADIIARKVVWGPYGQRGQNRQLLRLQSRPAMLRAIDDMNDRQYEALGCIVSSLLGASKVYLTAQGNEGGVDFFSLLPRPGKDHIFGGAYSPLRIVGQTKMYSSPVSVGEIRNFITTLNDIRTVSTSISRIIPPWFFDFEGPVVGWFIGHSGFQSGAIATCRNHGILYSSSLDLAEVAAGNRTISETLSPLERAKCLANLVDELLDKQG